MTIDIFTKSLPKDKPYQCIENMGMCLILKEKPNYQHQALMTFDGERYSTSLCGRFSYKCIHCTCVSLSQPTKPTPMAESWSGKKIYTTSCI